MKASKLKKPGKRADKMKITLSISRDALVALDLVRARRLERGASRSQVQVSALVEEAINLLRVKERL